MTTSNDEHKDGHFAVLGSVADWTGSPIYLLARLSNPNPKPFQPPSRQAKLCKAQRHPAPCGTNACYRIIPATDRSIDSGSRVGGKPSQARHAVFEIGRV